MAKSESFEEEKMPLLDHLFELRRRLLYSVAAFFVIFLICFFFAEPLYAFLLEPLANILLNQDNTNRTTPPRVIYTALTEGFFTYVKVAFFFAAFFTCPVFLLQLWRFVAPGLYTNEKKAMAPFIVATPVLFLLGAALVYYIIMPLAWEFFLSFQKMGTSDSLAIELEAKIGEYLRVVMALIFAFGLCFQLPVVITLMAQVGLVSAKGLAEKRKYAIVGVFVFAAVFTPPDPLSQIMLAIPIIGLYEISIYMAKIVEKKREEAQKSSS